jgi:hypothetical protein
MDFVVPSRAKSPDDGGSKQLRNVGKLPDDSISVVK